MSVNYLTEEDMAIFNRHGDSGHLTNGDRKDQWIINDLVRGQHGRKRQHCSSRFVLRAMRDGDRADVLVIRRWPGAQYYIATIFA